MAFNFDKYRDGSKGVGSSESTSFNFEKYRTGTQENRYAEQKQYADAMKPSRLMEIENTNRKKAEEAYTRKIMADEGIDIGSNTNRLVDLGKNIGPRLEAAEVQRKATEAAQPTFRERVNKRVEEAGWPSLLKPIGSAIAAVEELPFSRAVQQRTTMYPELQDPKDRVGGLAGFAADIAIPLTVPGAGLSGTGLYNQAGNVVQRHAPNLANSLKGRVASEAIKGSAIGAPLGVGATLATNPNASKEELLLGSAFGTGGGLLLGSASPLIGKAFTSFLNRGKSISPEAEQAVREAFEPQKAMSNLRNASQDQYVDRVMGQIKDDVYQRMTPPLENPNELAKWIKPHLGDDVSLNEIRRLSFDDMTQLANEIKSGIKMYDVASQVAKERGFNLDELFAGKIPKIKDVVARDASRRAYGFGDAPNVNIQRTVRPEGPFPPRVKTEPPSRPNPNPVEQAVPDTSTVRESVVPTIINDQPAQGPTRQRGFAQTLIESDKTPQGFKDRIRSAYTPITNEQTLAQANKRINKDIEEATSYVMGNSRFTAEKATTAQRLIDHYNSTGNYQRAVDVAEKVSEEATRAGQSIQALSMFDNLTPEGVLIRAQRLAQKTNEKLPITAREVKVTPEMAENIAGLAQTTQRMTGVKDLSNDVINILERAKTGEKLSDADAQTLKRFVNESKQFIKDVSKPPKPPRAPSQPKDSRIKDNVVKFLDAQEQAAKDRLKARGIRLSSTPLDTWADYAIIGAAKMGKGTIKFADWSAAMIKELGEDIRPYLNQLYERSREAFEASTKKVTSQTISEAEKIAEKVIKNKELTGDQASNIRSLAQKVSRLSGEEKNIATQDLQVILQALEKPTFLKKVATAQTIGQLLNPKTQVRNIVGNELFYRLERLNKYIATPIDIARSKLTGGQRTVTFRTNNQGEFWKNWLRGAKAGWKGTNVNGIQTQYDIGSPAFKSKLNPLRYLEKALGASLKSFDTAAYMRGVNNTLGEQATLRAINEGRAGDKALIQKYIREADDNIAKLADEYGRYITFQDNNLISQGLVKLKRGLNVGKDFGIGDLVLKYPKTPGALLHRAMEYSPIGFLRSAAILARPIFRKEASTSEVTQALSRAIIGSLGLTGMGYALADLGILTGAASKDRDVRELQRQSGEGQYQVNLSALMRFVKSGFNPSAAKLKENDLLYSYDWAQPLSMPMSIGANVVKNMNEGKQKFSGMVGTAYNSLEGALGTLTEQSVLQGVRKAAEGYPGQTVTDKIVDVLSDIPSSFVPTFSNQIKQITDNSKRETYSPNKLEQTINKAKAKIPGSLSGNMPKQYDTLGREKETYQDNSLFNVFLNPGFSSRYKLSPEAKYIVDLIEESGDEAVAPRIPGKSIVIDGQTIKLDGDMYSRLQQLQGEETRKRIENRLKTDPNKKLTTRVKNISKDLTKAGEKARKTLSKEFNIK